MAVRRLFGSCKSACFGYASKNKVISACVAVLTLFLIADIAIISPHVKVEQKVDANNFLSPWDTRPAPSPCALRESVIIKPAQVAVTKAKAKEAVKVKQSGKTSKIVVASTSR